MQRNGPRGWKLDTGQEGTRILFRDYHKAILDNLITKTGDEVKSWDSGEMWEALKEQGIKISRASVIFYMNFLVEDGVAGYDDATGKGGHRKKYWVDRNWDDIRKHIAIKVVESLGEGLDLDLDWILAKWL